ncbi:MAG: 6,7-dimethyl-8-ribityllumazine synthase [Proteobacteria bacterium]|nr:6,7-dimethyl-8-ribityllumazine synthase [Pseudomonadota bacterium]
MKSKSGPNVVEGALDAKGLKFAIVTARFNHFIVDRMIEGCLDALERHGCDTSGCELFRVPGSFELPIVVRKVAENQKFDGVIALGAVIRGSTPHFDYIAAEVTKGLAQAALETIRPVAYGVITTDTIEQAIERAGTKSGNKGWEAALSAIEMANLFKKL